MIRKKRKLLVTFTLVMAFILTIGITASANELSILDRYLGDDLAEDQSVTQGQAVKAIIEHFNYDVPEEVEEPNFDNLEGEELKYAEAALIAGLIEESSEFDFDEELEREEVTAMLMDATRIEEEMDSSLLDEYDDSDKVDEEFEEEISLAVEMGLLAGDSETQLSPDREMTLKEMDTVLCRLVNNYKQIDALSTNDFHGRVESGDEPGAAKVMGAITHYRDANEDGTFVIDGGDSFQGTPISNLNDGDPVAEFMNKAGYVAQAIGNHEFDWGTDKVEYFDEITDFPLMAANIVYKDSGEHVEWATPTEMITVDGLDIGLIGIATPDTRGTVMPSNIEDIEFTDPAESIKERAKTLEEEGADMIIVVSHMPGETDSETGEVSGELIETAEKVNVDGIVGGHSHHLVTAVVNDNAVVEAGNHGRYLGNLRFFVDAEDDEVYNAKPMTHPVRDNIINIEKDQETQEMVDGYAEELESQMEETVITTEEKLEREYNDISEIGALITESMKNVASADIAFQNPGGIRIDLPAGDITVGHMYELLPFGNTIVKAEMTGEQIVKVLEQSLTLEKGMLQHTGLEVKYDMDKEEYNRVVEVTLPDGTPLEMDKEYTVATNNFLAEGGDKFETFTEVEFSNTNVLVRDALLNFLRELDSIDVDIEDRAVEVDDSAALFIKFAA
ncbi:MAG: bifunctional metallophosphatase/5'-nucleotidase [Halanaerobiales bacterium]